MSSKKGKKKKNKKFKKHENMCNFELDYDLVEQDFKKILPESLSDLSVGVYYGDSIKSKLLNAVGINTVGRLVLVGGFLHILAIVVALIFAYIELGG